MISQAYESSMNDFRLKQKDISAYFPVVLSEDYEKSLICFLEFYDTLERRVEETKSIFKKLFETFVAKNPNQTPDMIHFAAACCLRHALKFTETFVTAEDYALLAIENWRLMVNPQFTEEHFIQFEQMLFLSNDYSPSFTTPFHYFGLFCKVFPVTKSHKEATWRMLNLCFTISELITYNAEQVFFGCLLATWTEQDIPLQWILNQTHYPQESINAAQIIFEVYQEAIQPPQ